MSEKKAKTVADNIEARLEKIQKLAPPCPARGKCPDNPCIYRLAAEAKTHLANPPADNSLDDVMHPDGTMRSCFAPTDSEDDASEPQAAPPELKLCPFCDSNKVQSGSILYPFYIYCSNCLAHGPHEGSENLGKKWNTRTSTAEALAEALREAKRIIKLNVGQISNQGWETFEQNSPVMRQINTALARWEGKGES